MKNSIILVCSFLFIACVNKPKQHEDIKTSGIAKDLITLRKIYYKFSDEVKEEIESKLNKIDNKHVYKYGLIFEICDVDKGDYKLTLVTTNNALLQYYFENSNKFVIISKDIQLPLISNDIYFSKEPEDYVSDEKLGYGGCIETIHFNDDKIIKIETCGNGL